MSSRSDSVPVLAVVRKGILQYLSVLRQILGSKNGFHHVHLAIRSLFENPSTLPAMPKFTLRAVLPSFS